MAYGILDILLRLNTKDLKKGITTSEALLEKFKDFGISAFKGLLLSPIALGAGAAAGLTALTKSSLDTIDTVGKLTDTLGWSTEKFTGYAHAADLAGVNQEDFGAVLKKMNVNLSNSATSGQGATDSLKLMGLSAKELANSSPDAAFLKIADGIKGVENSSQRAAIAQEIFGKQGQSLIPLMLSGSEAIKEAANEAERLGLTYDRVDAAKVEAANDAWSRVLKTFVGIGNTLAIEIAPYMEGIAKSFTDWAKSGDGVKGSVGGALEGVGSALKYILQYIDTIRGIWQLTSRLFGATISLILLPLAKVESALERIAGLLGVKLPTYLNDFKGKIDRGNAGIDKAFLAPGLAERAEQEAKKIKQAAAKAAKDLVGPAKDNAATNQRTAQIKAQTDYEELLYKIERDGAKKRKEADKKSREEGRKDFEKYKEDLKKEAEDVVKSNMSPLEKFREEMEHLQMLKENGHLTDEQFQRATGKVANDFRGSFGNVGRTATVLEAGTSAAFDAIDNRSEGITKPLNSLVDLAKQQLEEQKKANAKTTEEVLSLL